MCQKSLNRRMALVSHRIDIRCTFISYDVNEQVMLFYYYWHLFLHIFFFYTERRIFLNVIFVLSSYRIDGMSEFSSILRVSLWFMCLCESRFLWLLDINDVQQTHEHKKRHTTIQHLNSVQKRSHLNINV